MAPKSKTNKRKASPPEDSTGTSKSPKLTLKGPRSQLKDNTGDNSEKPLKGKGSKKSQETDKAPKVKEPAQPAKGSPSKKAKGISGGASGIAQPQAQQAQSGPATPTSSRIPSRAAYSRTPELMGMIGTLRLFARVEEDPALEPFLDLLSEAYSAMGDVVPVTR